ncbi:MAG: hypothetical protein AAF212_13445 [Verrucomicrobiota bacterium]
MSEKNKTTAINPVDQTIEAETSTISKREVDAAQERLSAAADAMADALLQVQHAVAQTARNIASIEMKEENALENVSTTLITDGQKAVQASLKVISNAINATDSAIEGYQYNETPDTESD